MENTPYFYVVLLQHNGDMWHDGGHVALEAAS